MIALVILTYRADPATLEGCLTSVVASGDAERIVLVDNGGTVERAWLDRVVRSTGADPAIVDLLVSHHNSGFAGGMNAGMSHALTLGATAVAVLNDDTAVEPGWLGRLTEELAAARSTGRVGAVQPKLLLGLPGRGHPTSGPVINSVGMSVRTDGAGVDVGFGEPDTGQYDGLRSIELFTGGAVLFDGAFLADVGGFDPRYFMYYEDIDLARRGHDAGWGYLLVADAVVHHAWSESARTVPGLHRYWQERNRLWWLFRHGTPWQIARGLLLSLGRLAKHPTKPQASAVLHGLRGAPRSLRERRARTVRVVPLPMSGPPAWDVA